MRHILDQLIIVAGQWQSIGGGCYQLQFMLLLNQLAKAANTNQEGAIEILMLDLEGSAVA